MIAVSYHDRVDVLQEAKPVSAGPFGNAGWFELLAEAPDSRAIFAVARDDRDNGAMAALALRQSANRLDALANWYAFTWRPLITEGADELALLTALARDLKSRARRVVLAPLPDEDGSASLLEEAFRTAGWAAFRSTCDSNHMLPVRGRSYAGYLATRPGPLRTTLARKAKRFEIDIITDFQEEVWSSYEDIYKMSWKPAEGDPDLLRRFAEREGAAGHLRLGIARHEGHAVAAQFWTAESGTAYIHKLAHLPEAQPLSAGTVLTAALMEHVIDRDRVQTVDFGTGNDAYKADWMEQVRPRFLLDCHDPARLASWPHIARGMLRRLATGKSAG